MDNCAKGFESFVTDVLLSCHLGQRVLLAVPAGFKVDAQDSFVWFAQVAFSF
jgi:hypothetical protein